jgi:hypothetical protein
MNICTLLGLFMRGYCLALGHRRRKHQTFLFECFPRNTLHSLNNFMRLCSTMDPAWEHYTRMRAYHEFTFRSGDVVKAAQDHGKSVMDRIMPRLLKVRSSTNTFTAFYINASPCLFASTAHGIPPGITELQAVNTFGNVSSIQVKYSGTEYGMDLAILEVPDESKIVPNAGIQPCTLIPSSLGDTVYMFGFAGSGLDVHFTTGNITSMRNTVCSTDAYADHGFSGGPAVNIAGDVVGVIQSGDDGITNKQSLLISAVQLLTFMQMKGISIN